MPQFSIVITCHNQAKFIADAVSSALSQRYPDKEVILVDDASTDASAAILEHYKHAARVITSPTNIGACQARNLGAASATGEYLVFLDGDDLLLPWALDVYAHVLSRRKASVILGKMVWFEGSTPPTPLEDSPKEVKFVTFHPLVAKDRSHRTSASAIVVQRQVFHEIQGWTAGMFPFEDFEILLKLSRCHAVQLVSPPATSYRMHANNAVRSVAPFLPPLRRIITKLKRSEYPCSRSHRLASYALVGGPTLYWAKRAYSCGLPRDALRLLASGWAMILAAVLYRSRVLLKGRQPFEVISL